MYRYGLKLAVWRGSESVVREWFLATEDIEHESDAFEAKHIISCKALACSKTPSLVVEEYLFAGISILSCADSCLPLTIGRSELEVLKHQLSAAWTGVYIWFSHPRQAPNLYVLSLCFRSQKISSIPNSKQSSSNSSVVYLILISPSSI